MDPEKPVVKPCGQGIQAELARRDDEALPQVPEGPYRSVVEHGIGAALARVAG